LAIQKSVFWGHLNRAEENAVRRLFKQYCRQGDKAFVARIKLAAQIKLNSFGYSPEEIPLKPVDYYVV
jgi:CRISPR/Cas system-associated endoribonuclease Cas2